LRSWQYRLWALLALAAIAAVLMALGRWAGAQRTALDLAWENPGALPTEWALVLEGMALALVLVAAIDRKRVRALVFSIDGMAFVGGVCMLTSGFFRYRSGPWGGGLSLYGSPPVDLRFFGRSALPSAWPMMFGALAASLSAMAILAGNTPACRRRWTAAALFLWILAYAMVALRVWAGFSSPDDAAMITNFAVYCIMLATVTATVGLVRDGDRKFRLINLIATAALFPSLYPTMTMCGVAMPLREVLRSMGPGYWMLVLGTMLVFFSSIYALAWPRRWLAAPTETGQVEPRT
jgi:hypothetical protein